MRAWRLSQQVLLLDNVRSAFNVGSILRTAETAAVKQVLRVPRPAPATRS